MTNLIVGTSKTDVPLGVFDWSLDEITILYYNSNRKLLTEGLGDLTPVFLYTYNVLSSLS